MAMTILASFEALGFDSSERDERKIFSAMATALADAIDDEYTIDDRVFFHTSMLFGEPGGELIAMVDTWCHDIQQQFSDSLKQIGSCSNVDSIPVDDNSTFQLKLATRELDNDWFRQSTHGVYVENIIGMPYFTVLPSQDVVADVHSNPSEYLVIKIPLE